MNLLIRTYSSNDEYNADISYVFVKVTAELAKTILKRAKAFKRLQDEDGDVLELSCHDRDAMYVRDVVAEGLQAEDLRGFSRNEYVEIPNEVGENFSEHVELCRMNIDEGTVEFCAVPKHSDITITSYRVPLSLIEKAIK